MIITITIPDDDGEQVTVVAQKGDLGAINTMPRADFTDLIEAANNILADILANPPNIPPQPERPVYTPPPKIDLNAEAEKMLPQLRETVAGWDFVKAKITVKNMAAHLKSTDKVTEAALKKLVEEKALKALKYNQFGPPDPPPPPGLFDSLPEEAEPAEEPQISEMDEQIETHLAQESEDSAEFEEPEESDVELAE